MAHVFVAGYVEDEEVNGHPDSGEGVAGDGRLVVGVEAGDDDGEVEVAVGAEVAAGAEPNATMRTGLAAATMRSTAARTFYSETLISSSAVAVAMG
jgi:hypothetical protein